MARQRLRATIDPTKVLLGGLPARGSEPSEASEASGATRAEVPARVVARARRKVTVELPLDACEALRLHAYVSGRAMTDLVAEAVGKAEGAGWPEPSKAFQSTDRRQLGFWVPDDLYLALKRRSYLERTTIKDGVLRAVELAASGWNDETA